MASPASLRGWPFGFVGLLYFDYVSISSGFGCWLLYVSISQGDGSNADEVLVDAPLLQKLLAFLKLKDFLAAVDPA